MSGRVDIAAYVREPVSAWYCFSFSKQTLLRLLVGVNPYPLVSLWDYSRSYRIFEQRIDVLGLRHFERAFMSISCD